MGGRAMGREWGLMGCWRGVRRDMGVGRKWFRRLLEGKERVTTREVVRSRRWIAMMWMVWRLS